MGLACTATFVSFSATSFGDSFKDVNEINTTIYERVSIENLQASGAIAGYADGTFKPLGTINRAEFLKILMETKGLIELGSNCYSDVQNEWFAPYVCAAKDLGIVGGYSDGTFKPEQNINFAEASKILALTFKLPVENKYIDTWYEKYVVALEQARAIPDSIVNFNKSLTRAEMAYSAYVLSSSRFLYKEQLTYADIKALQESGLSLKLMKKFDTQHLYTDGQKVYEVSYGDITEIIGADAGSFSLLNQDFTSKIYKDKDNLFFLSYGGDSYNGGQAYRYIYLYDLDYDTTEILHTEMFNIEPSDSEYHEPGSTNIVLRDKNGIYQITGGISYTTGISNITGDVENLEAYEPYLCGDICGTDGKNFYYVESYDGALKKLNGLDYATMSTVEDADGTFIPILFKDKDNIYELPKHGGVKVTGANAAKFEVIYYDIQDNSSYYFPYIYFKDDQSVWRYSYNVWPYGIEIIPGGDPDDFDYEKDLEKLKESLGA